jgi:hypothetical protein
VPATPRPVEVTLERTVADSAGGPPLTVRLSVQLTGDALDAEGLSTLRTELDGLRGQLDRFVESLQPGASSAPRTDRPVEELIETYRPRQPELLELLRAEGELTAGEYDSLRHHLSAPPPAPPPPAGIPVAERPIVAAPLEGDRAPSQARPVEELLRVYQLSSLKQAGAVRARRQISFEEYMALKRHFGPPAAT